MERRAEKIGVPLITLFFQFARVTGIGAAQIDQDAAGSEGGEESLLS